MEHPDKYWHCYVKLQGNNKYAVQNDMTFDELQTRILTPWHQSAPFTVSGKIVNKDSQIEEINVTQTDEPQRVWADRHDARQDAINVCDLATDRRMLPIWHGQDLTFDLLFAGKKEPCPSADVALIEQICKRMPYAARILLNRQRKGKISYTIEDEYDVQDLLHALLRAYLKYSVQEDPLPKVSGTRASRADISIEELGILIEIKYVRSPDDQKTIFDDFSRDVLLYTSWPHLKTLLYVIYNSGDLRDPEALEKLSGPRATNGKEFDVKIVLA